MSTLDDRIRALDPFADAPYAHADADAMVERVTTATPARPRRRRLAVLLAPMSAVAAAGLATGLLVTAGTTAAPSLVALHVAGSTHRFAAGSPLGLRFDTNGVAYEGAEAGFALPAPSALFAQSTAASASTNFYVVSGQLPTSTPSLAAYQVVSPARPADVLTASAATLPLRGAVERVAPSEWRLGALAHVHGAAVAGMYRSSSGLYDFEYLRDGLARPSARCATSAPSGAVDTDRLAMSSSVANLLAALGLRYELAVATYQASWSRAARDGCTGTVVRDATILVGGVATDQVVRAAFDPEGRLVAASLPVFMLGRPAAYPLVSAATAADALVRTSSELGVTAAGHGASTSATPSRSRRPQDLLIVELRSSSIALHAFTTTTGVTWLLPVYALYGDGYTDVAAGPTGWSGDVVATAAPFVRIVGTSVNQARVFDEQRFGTQP